MVCLISIPLFDNEIKCWKVQLPLATVEILLLHDHHVIVLLGLYVLCYQEFHRCLVNWKLFCYLYLYHIAKSQLCQTVRPLMLILKVPSSGLAVRQTEFQTFGNQVEDISSILIGPELHSLEIF